MWVASSDQQSSRAGKVGLCEVVDGRRGGGGVDVEAEEGEGEGEGEPWWLVVEWW